VRRSSAFPLVVSGPSGAGKSTLVEELLKRVEGLAYSVSVTTRRPRAGEVEGEDYRFVDEEEFERMKEGELIEWARVHGHLYGTPRSFIEGKLAEGQDVVLEIDVQGGLKVKKAFPQAVMVFILPPTWEELERRIRGRGTDQPGEVERRLANARGEVTQVFNYDYLIVNDEVEEAVRELEAVVVAERCRRGRYPDKFLREFTGGEG